MILMRYIIIFLIFFVSVNAQERELDRSIIIDKSIRHYSPHINKRLSKRIAKAVLASSMRWGVDWRVLLAILQQESSFRVDPQGCIHKKCSDYGIGQINFKTWGDILGLSKKKLLTDVSYNINAVGQILSMVKKGHEKNSKWYLRYHSLNHNRQLVYNSFVAPKVKRIKLYASRNYYK